MGLIDIKNLPDPFIIADIGSNWKTANNPSDNLIMAKRHIHDAAKAGVDAVKFQLFTDRELYGMEGPNQWSLPKEWILDLAAYASDQNVEFMCTAFSPQGYAFLNPFVNLHKVASSEMKHVECLEILEAFGKPVLISTGAANQLEIDAVTNYFCSKQNPNFGFLECIASYPAKPEDYNLSTLKQPEFVGVSDHTKTDVVALTAVGLGARIFEKHFTVFDQPWGDHLYGDESHRVSTPDYPVSIGPVAMTQYVRGIHQAKQCLGSGPKVGRPSEQDMVSRHRRRLKVIAPIKAGETLRFEENFGIYRSIKVDLEAAGPENWELFDQGVAKRNLEPGDPVWHGTVEPSVGSTCARDFPIPNG